MNGGGALRTVWLLVRRAVWYVETGPPESNALMRSFGIFLQTLALTLPMAGCGAKPTPEQAEAIAMIERLGGRLKFADDRPGRPVVEIALGGTPVADADLRRLACFPELETLSLFDSAIGDQGLARLALFVKLQTLYLGRTRVTDDGLTVLADMSKLKTLGLSDTQITDVGLTHLKTLGELRSVNLRRARTTVAGLQALKQAAPQLVIHQ